VPHATSLLADVVTRDPGEAVLAGLEQHTLEEEAVGGLLLAALRDRDPGASHAVGEVVTDALELLEVDQARLGRGVGRKPETAHGKGGDEGVGELSLKLGDLTAQRPARVALADLDARCGRFVKRFHPGYGDALSQLHCGLL
jgi:hypothetical protein